MLAGYWLDQTLFLSSIVTQSLRFRDPHWMDPIITCGWISDLHVFIHDKWTSISTIFWTCSNDYSNSISNSLCSNLNWTYIILLAWYLVYDRLSQNSGSLSCIKRAYSHDSLHFFFCLFVCEWDYIVNQLHLTIQHLSSSFYFSPIFFLQQLFN